MEKGDRLKVLEGILLEEQENLRGIMKEDGYDAFIDGAICSISHILELSRYVGAGCNTLSEIYKMQADFAKIRERLASKGIYID